MVRTRSSPAEPFRVLDPNLNNQENISPPIVNRRENRATRNAFPFTPDTKSVYQTKEHFTGKRSVDDTKLSPVLQKLKQTPGRTYQTQQILLQKHQEAKSNVEKCVGGGISMWPEMDDMRLTSSDIWSLTANVITLFVLTFGIYHYLHGAVLSDLSQFIQRLETFSAQHPLKTSDQTLFVKSLLRWHRDYSQLLERITISIEVSWESCPPSYPLLIFVYITGISTLLYFIYESAFSKNRLTPQRIKQWVSLLVVLMTWTVLMLHLLVQAEKLEHLVQKNVHKLNSYMEDLVFSELDLKKYEYTLQYWVTRCLPPRSRGMLSLLGVVKVRDFTYYLVYYLVPIGTALLTPIVKLVLAFCEVYRPKSH